MRQINGEKDFKKLKFDLPKAVAISSKPSFSVSCHDPTNCCNPAIFK